MMLLLYAVHPCGALPSSRSGASQTGVSNMPLEVASDLAFQHLSP
jgi:hypothetical protein